MDEGSLKGPRGPGTKVPPVGEQGTKGTKAPVDQGTRDQGTKGSKGPKERTKGPRNQGTNAS
eukprot:12419520-Karenia_brevis.AAC.2